MQRLIHKDTQAFNPHHIAERPLRGSIAHFIRGQEDTTDTKNDSSNIINQTILQEETNRSDKEHAGRAYLLIKTNDKGGTLFQYWPLTTFQ